ncbi:MAG: GAF domain-containing protein [Magnetococcales bacterium]|nr:GAF domain-containing protein [Magnetococcales bacterium]
MRTLICWLLNHRRTALLLIVLGALAGSLVAGHLFRSVMERDFRHQLEGMAQREAVSLELETMRGRAMGVTSLLGLNEPILKELVTGKRTQNDAEGLARMRVARLMLDADGIYVMNNEGKIVVHESDHESSVGKNIKFRPYWQQAMAGKENVYAAVGSKTQERGLYVADAIRAGSILQGAIIGVVVIKMLGDYLDQTIAVPNRKALLLSPQGVVFASTEKEWVFRLNGEPTPARLEEIAKLNQFGKLYEKGNVPHTLPFDVLQEEICIGQARYARAMAKLRWNDPAGDWSLVLLGDLEYATPIEEMLLVIFLTGMGNFALLFLALRAMRESRAKQEAMAKTHEAAEKLVVEARTKSRHAEFAVTLQQARDLEGLCRGWFSQLNQFFPIHQATLYVLEGEDSGALLIKVGAFGDALAPESIRLGEGWLGECAIDHQPMVFHLPEEGFWRIESGLGSVAPRCLMILPVLRGERLLGVLEMASLDATFGAHQREILEMTQQLAANLEILLIARRTEETLEEARRAKNWLLDLLDGIPDAVLVIDSEERIRLANQPANLLWGLERQDATALRLPWNSRKSLQGMEAEGAQPPSCQLTDLLPEGLCDTPDYRQWVKSPSGDLMLAHVEPLLLPDHPDWGACLGIRIRIVGDEVKQEVSS